jgi:calcium-binding protein CML
MFDTDGSGTLMTTDLELVLLGFGIKKGVDEMNDIIKEVDEGGHVTFESFLELMAGIVLGDRTEQAREVFSLMDTDRGGSISPVELRHLMVNLGEVIPDEEVEKMISEADLDGEAGSSWHWQLSVLVDR